MNKIIFYSLSILILFSCESNKETSIVNKEKCVEVYPEFLKVNSIDSNFTLKKLRKFNDEINNLLRLKTKKNNISYIMLCDSFIKFEHGIDYEFFGNDSLVNVAIFNFNPDNDFNEYGFNLRVYNYGSLKSTQKALNKVYSMNTVDDFGIGKCNQNVFMFKNRIFYLSSDCKLSSFNFDKICNILKKEISTKNESIVDMNTLSHFNKLTSLKSDILKNKWKMNFYSTLYLNTEKKETIEDNLVIEFNDNELVFKGNHYYFDIIYKRLIPDIKGMMLMLGKIAKERGTLNPKLECFNGYTTFYELELKIDYNSPENTKIIPYYNLFKITDNQFGFVYNDNFYLLEKIKTL